MSIISASTLTTTALQLTADTAGTLVFRTGATPTTALTLGADQSATFAGTVNFAAAGFTSLSISGNLTFTSTGNRIIGDFTNATAANRVFFQTSTVNGNTNVGLMPNGTGVISLLQCYASSDLNNSPFFDLRCDSSNDARLRSGITGTGTYLPMTFYTGGSERLRIDTSGNVGIGTSSPDNNANYKTLTITGSTTTTGGVIGFKSSDGSAFAQIFNDSTSFALKNNSATPTTIFTSGLERMRIDASGNVLVGGTTQRLNAKITNNGAYWSGSGNSSGDAEYFFSNYATPAVAWAMSVRQDVGGANNDLKFLRLNSSGSFQDIAMQITQAEGNVNLIKNLGIGGATATTLGTGITFPATQSASSNANTLDDYEEGTWTPTGNGITFSSAYGNYTKIGNTCTIWWDVAWPSTSDSGSAYIGGLPFTLAANSWSGAMAITNVGIADVLAFAHAGQAYVYHRNSSNSDYSNAQFSTKFAYGFATFKVA